jgi:hypothetical protein
VKELGYLYKTSHCLRAAPGNNSWLCPLAYVGHVDFQSQRKPWGRNGGAGSKNAFQPGSPNIWGKAAGGWGSSHICWISVIVVSRVSYLIFSNWILINVPQNSPQ